MPMRRLLFPVLLVFPVLGLAQSFSVIEPRSMAMGGTGVAGASPSAAHSFNPALLAAPKRDENFNLVLPFVGAQARMSNEFDERIEDLEDQADALDESINRAETSLYNPTAYQDLAEATLAMNEALKAVDEGYVQAQVDVGTVVALPNKEMGIAVGYIGRGSLSAKIHYANSDAQLLTDVATDADLYAQWLACTDPSCSTPPDLTLVDLNTGEVYLDPDTQLESRVNIRATLQKSLGVSLAREFTLMGQTLSLGVTPKLVNTLVYDYRASASTTGDDTDEDDYRRSYNSINLDVGVVKDFDEHWRLALALRDVIPYSFDTYADLDGDGRQEKTGYTMDYQPRMRVGGAYQSNMAMATVDLDLSNPNPLNGRMQRNLALGGELYVTKIVSLRAGLNTDLADNSQPVYSGGLGLWLFGAQLDFALMGGDNQLGAAAQLGMSF